LRRLALQKVLDRVGGGANPSQDMPRKRKV
jgi:hypothetical protein